MGGLFTGSVLLTEACGCITTEHMEEVMQGAMMTDVLVPAILTSSSMMDGIVSAMHPSDFEKPFQKRPIYTILP